MARRSGMITFRELIERDYLAKGFNKLQAWTMIYTACGVCFHSSRAAFNGTRVLPETAETLWEWALRNHGAEIDRLALTKAPPAKPRKVRVVTRACNG